MKKYEHLPLYVQKAIDAKERREKARILAWGEKTATDQYNAFYIQRATDNTSNFDKKEINNWIELD